MSVIARNNKIGHWQSEKKEISGPYNSAVRSNWRMLPLLKFKRILYLRLVRRVCHILGEVIMNYDIVGDKLEITCSRQASEFIIAQTAHWV